MIDIKEVLNNSGGRMLSTGAEGLYKACMEIQAKSIVEIGSMDGGSTCVLGDAARENDGHLFSIEPNPKQRARANIEKYQLEKFITHIFHASPWVPIEKIKLPIDFIFIDGDHRTRWEIVDYHYWEKYVRVGGMIAFHDICGRKGVKDWVWRGLNIILEDDAHKLKEYARYEGPDRGTIIFQKIA